MKDVVLRYMKKIILTALFISFFGTTVDYSLAGYFNDSPVVSCGTQITRNLSFGSSNDEVYELQEILYQGGYLSAEPNGYFGYATKSAVKNFQYDNDISATGVVGKITRDVINNRFCNGVIGNYSHNYTNIGITYVGSQDPYVKVITPNNQGFINYSTPSIGVSNTPNSTNNVYSITPSYTNTSATNASVIYNPSMGYTYGIVPQSGSVTITSPSANVTYNEGDTVYLNWLTNNFTYSQFQVILENISTGKSHIINTVSGNSYSFTLTRDILDSICAGICTNYQQGSYRIVLATPYQDIAGNVSTFKAAIAPVTIYRPYTFYGISSLTGSKSPVNSGEIFRLYVNIPTGASYNSNLIGPYSININATCPTNVTVSIGGYGCGQDFSIPQAALAYQQEIPVMASNTGWFAQGVVFNMTVYNVYGQIVSTASTTIQVNQVARSF